MKGLHPRIASLPLEYRIEMGGNIEEFLKANVALGQVSPRIIAATLIVIIPQVRSLLTRTMVMLTALLALGSDVAPVQSAVRLQRDSRTDWTGGYPHAQHVDPDGADQGKPGGGAR